MHLSISRKGDRSRAVPLRFSNRSGLHKSRKKKIPTRYFIYRPSIFKFVNPMPWSKRDLPFLNAAAKIISSNILEKFLLSVKELSIRRDGS